MIKLQNGMIVETVDKYKYVVIGDSMYNLNTLHTVVGLRNAQDGTRWEIVSVYKVKDDIDGGIADFIYDENLELIWKKMTIDDIEKILGHGVEIID